MKTMTLRNKVQGKVLSPGRGAQHKRVELVRPNRLPGKRPWRREDQRVESHAGEKPRSLSASVSCDRDGPACEAGSWLAGPWRSNPPTQLLSRQKHVKRKNCEGTYLLFRMAVRYIQFAWNSDSPSFYCGNSSAVGLVCDFDFQRLPYTE